MSGLARSVVVALGTGLAACGAWQVVATQGAGGPTLVGGLLIMVSAIFEGRYARANSTQRPAGADWQQTAETFRDEETGRMVTVWFNPHTAERRYVEDGHA